VLNVSISEQRYESLTSKEVWIRLDDRVAWWTNVLTLSFLWSKQQSTTGWFAWQSDMIPLDAESLSTLTVNTQQSTARMDGNLSIVKEAEANYCWATYCYLKSGRTTCRHRRGYQALKFVPLGDAQLICKEDASHWILDWLSTLDEAHKVTVRWLSSVWQRWLDMMMHQYHLSIFIKAHCKQRYILGWSLIHNAAETTISSNGRCNLETDINQTLVFQYHNFLTSCGKE